MTSERELEALACDIYNSHRTERIMAGKTNVASWWGMDARHREHWMRVARRLQPARVPEFTRDDLPRTCYWITGSGTTRTAPLNGYRGCDVMDAVNTWARRHMLAAAPAAEGVTSEPAETDASGKYGDVIIERDERGLIQKVYRVGVIGKKLIATNPEYVAHPAPESREADHSPGAGNMVPGDGQREGESPFGSDDDIQPQTYLPSCAAPARSQSYCGDGGREGVEAMAEAMYEAHRAEWGVDVAYGMATWEKIDTSIRNHWVNVARRLASAPQPTQRGEGA